MLDSKQSDAIQVLQDQRFQKLDESVQYFISQYAAGHTSLSALVKTNMRLVNEHTTTEARVVEATVSAHVTDEVSRAEQTITSLLTDAAGESTRAISQDIKRLRIQDLNDTERKRFLGSLRFPAMNERRNHVTDSHDGTFMWIFDADTAASDMTDGQSQLDSDSESDNSAEAPIQTLQSDKSSESTSEASMETDSDEADETNSNASGQNDSNPSRKTVSDNVDESNSEGSDDPDEVGSSVSVSGTSSSGSSSTSSRLGGWPGGARLWDDFHEWLLSESDIYWISGKAGSGKSTLVKFLATNDRTRAALSQWKEGSIVLSHYFWAPGISMQKDLRGLFCSLLHQALSQAPALLDSIVAQTGSYRDKENDADWSVTELQLLCMSTLVSYPFPMCIFLDGLDEVCENDVQNLLEFVENLRVIPNVKICVASRPEAVFQRRLSHHQHMRVQDLTRGDMWTYAWSILRARPLISAGSGTIPSRKFPTSIISRIVSRANGVFLWLHLVARSLRRGWDNGDDEAELASRLEVLPGELSDLYADMWSRLNEDSVIYREVAAEYFHLALSDLSVEDMAFHRSFVRPFRVLPKTLNLLQFMAITTKWFQEKSLDPTSGTETDGTVTTLCQDTEASIRKRCAGLLEVGRRKDRSGKPIGDSRQYRLSPVTFFHRTAHDFLVDSEKGREILSFHKSREEERYLRLALGKLASSRYDAASLGNICSSLLCVESPELRGRVCEILRIAWIFYDGCFLANNGALKSHPCFLSEIAAEGFEYFALSAISQDPSPRELASQILTEVFQIPFSKIWDHPTSSPDDFLHSLLRLGADPNARRTRCGELSDPRLTMRLDNLTPYGCAVLFSLNNGAFKLGRSLEIFLSTGRAPEGRFPISFLKDWDDFTLRFYYPFYGSLLCGLKRGLGKRGLGNPTRDRALGFCADGSLPLLLEGVKRQQGEHSPILNTVAEKCRRPGASRSCGEEIHVPIVVMYEDRNSGYRKPRAFRMVNEGTRAELGSLIKRWLFADGDLRSAVEEEITRVKEGIARDIDENDEAYEEIEVWSIPKVLKEEGCCLGL